MVSCELAWSCGQNLSPKKPIYAILTYTLGLFERVRLYFTHGLLGAKKLGQRESEPRESRLGTSRTPLASSVESFDRPSGSRGRGRNELVTGEKVMFDRCNWEELGFALVLLMDLNILLVRTQIR